MTIKALIVEDEQNNIDVLKHFVKYYCPKVKIEGIAKGVSKAKNLIDKLELDLIFLDIMLEEGTGFDLLDVIKDKNIQVIFITAFNEFAVKAFKYSAVDFLLKPLQIDELIQAIEKAEKQLENFNIKQQMEVLKQNLSKEKQENEFLAISMIDKIEFIKINDISHIIADGKYSTFIMKNKKQIVSSKNLGEYEKLLEDKKVFCRIHSKYLLNVNFIETVSKSKLVCFLKDQTELPISRRRKDDLYSQVGI